MKYLLLSLIAALMSSFSFAQVIHVQEDFNDTILPVGWSSSAVTGSANWSFGIDGSAFHTGNNNLDGTPMAFFDDDNLGAGSLNSQAVLLTSVFDNSMQTEIFLEFDYNFRNYGVPNTTDTFKVDVFDGVNWINVFFRDTDDCGNWLSCAGNYPHAQIDISAYANTSCQIRFTYDDGNNWAWYVGVDNVIVSSKPSIDLGVYRLTSPQSGCGLSANEQIAVEIINYGTDTINSFSIMCDINNGANVLIDTVNTILPPNDTIPHVFSTTTDFSLVGNYSLEIYTTLSTDTFPANDTLTTAIQTDSVYHLPYLDDFEGLSQWEISGVASSWVIGAPNSANINSATSGSNAIVTNLTGGYNYLEKSYITSQCFDLSNSFAPHVSFKLNYITEQNFDSLKFEYSIDNGITWNKVKEEFNVDNWYPNGNTWMGSSNGWQEVANTLKSLMGQPSVKFRFAFESDISINREGIAIDDFSIAENDSVDIAISSLLHPSITGGYSCGLGQEFIQVELSNNGSHAVDSTFLFYQVNGGAIVSDTLVDSIPPFSKRNFNFKAKYDFSGTNTYSVNAWAKVKGDTTIKNDSLLNQVVQNSQSASFYSLPFIEEFNEPSFQQGSEYFHTNDAIGNGWQRSSGYTWRTANSNKYRVNNKGANQDYNGAGSNFLYAESFGISSGDTAILESPCIDLSNSLHPLFEFKYHRFDTKIISPLMVDVYNGIDWIEIGNISGVNQSNMSDPWLAHQISLDQFAGRRVKIRFRTIKESCCNNNMAIDDIKIYDSDSVDTGISELVYQIDDAYLNDSIKVIIRNYGLNPLNGTIPISYSINNGAIVAENILLQNSLNSGDSISFTFNQVYDFSKAGKYNIQVWTGLSSDTNQINDTIKFQHENFIVTPVSHLENFESFIDDTCSLPITGPSSPAFYAAAYGNEYLQGWIEKSKNKYNWQVQNALTCGGTPSPFTGPNFDHTTGSGNFIFTEASRLNGSPAVRDTAILEGPFVNFKNSISAGMRFWYHRYGQNMGTLFIDVYANGIWNLNIDSLVGQTQFSSNQTWKQKKIIFSQFAGQNIKVRFRSIYGGGFEGDMAIDDVQFYIPIQKDARATALTVLEENCVSNSGQIQAEFNNNGLDTINTNELKIYYQVNKQQIFIDSNSTSIAPDSSIIQRFNLINLYSQSEDTITFWVSLSGDTNNVEDTISVTLSSPVRAPEYTEGFESLVPSNGFCGNYNTPLNLAWEAESNDQWVAGHDTICSYGSNGATPTSLTGPDSAYAGHGFMYFEPGFNSVVDTAVLTSTCIDLRNDSILYLDFYYHMYGAGTGKLYIDVDFNGNVIRVDSIVGQQHFANSDPWNKKIINLNQFAGDIIRIRFTAIESSSSVSDQGAISIDNVRISNSFPVSVNKALEYSNALELFPNPTNGEFILRGNGYATSEYLISVMDLNGRLIESRTVNPDSNTINERFDLSNQANGVYLISIRGGGKVEVKRVVLSGR